MNGLIEIIWCPNPLRPVADRKVQRLLSTGTDTVDSLVKRLGLHSTPLVATLNGVDVLHRRWGRKRVRPGDVLLLVQRARGETVAAKIIMDFAWYEIAAAAAMYVLTSDIVIGLAINMLINSLAGGSNSGAQNSGNADSAIAAYSIEGGANQARPYAPLPLVLGEHRMFPDYASKPFGEFVVDLDTAYDVINATPVLLNTAAAAFTTTGPISSPTVSAPWTLLGSIGTMQYYGDNITRTYVVTGGATVIQPHTFVIQYNTSTGLPVAITDHESFLLVGDDYTPPAQNWRALGTELPIIQRYGYVAYYNTERLTSIFNWGFGDLEVSDLLIGSTPLDQFTSWQRHDSSVPADQGDRTQLLGYTSAGWPGTAYPGNVQSVEGGKLEQRASVTNSGWIERQGSKACHYIQIDIAGRLFRQGNGGIEVLSCEVEAQYMAAGSSSWVDFGFSPISVSSGSSTPVRNTYSELLAVDVLKVRVRRSTPEPSDARDVSDLEWSRVKFIRNTDALYPAQYRTGLMINATGQLNGRIDRLGGLVRAKHWIWNSASAWTPGVLPGDGAAPWVWGFTTNPAWLFLYYARGGFINPTAAPAYLGLKGWLDRPDAGNGARLFGAGLTNDRIDYAAIVAWAQYCDAVNLQCRLVIDEQRSAGDVLDSIAAAGRASKSWATGKLSVVWEAAGQPVVAAFGMSNILAGTFNISYDTDTTVDEYALQYTRSDDAYAPDTVYAAVPGAAQLVGQKSETAVYAMPQAQAQRLVNLLAASRKYHRRKITWESTLEALAVQRGDIVHLAHDLTQWAFSGRLVNLVAIDGYITQVQTACEVDNASAASFFYLWIRQPGGTYMSVQCAPPVGRTNVLQITGSWPVADAPGVLGQTLTTQNLASNWPDTIPEDWMFLAGPTATPGKRARIIGIEPSSQRRVRITARDEYEAYYPLEYGLGGAPDVVSGEQLVARAYNLSARPLETGGTLLTWELEHAHGAEVMLSVNGGASSQVPINGHMTVSGTDLLLPAYASGTHLAIELLPVAAGTPIAVQGDSLEVVV